MVGLRKPGGAPRCAGLVTLLCLLGFGWNNLGRAAGAKVAITWEDAMLSLQAEAVPLDEVLHQLGAELGFTVVLWGDLQAPVTRTVDRLPLADAIETLVGSHSVVVVYEAGAAVAGQGAVAEVWVFEKGADSTDLAQTSRPPRTSPADSTPAPGQSGYPDRWSGREALAISPRLPLNEELQLLQRLLQRDEDAQVRQRAVARLAEIGGDHVLPHLSAVLADPDVAVRLRAVEGLTAIGSVRSLQLLGRAVLGDRDAAVRLEAVRSLAEFDHPVARAFLTTAAGDADAQVQKLAVQLLGR